MLDRFDRYVARNVLWSMLIVQVALLGLDFLIGFINELGAAARDYGPAQMLTYHAMRLPGRFYSYAPVGVLLGGLLGLGKMASSNELTAIRAAGRSIMRIIWGAMKPLLLVIALTMAIGEWWVPLAEQSAEAFQQERQKGVSTLSQNGGWQVEGNDFYRFGTIRADDTLLNVTHFVFSGHTLKAVISAASATWDDHTRQWTLHQVTTTTLHDERTQTSSQPTASWETAFSPDFLTLVLMDPTTQSLRELWRYGHYLNAQGSDGHAAWLNFWLKALQPLALMGLMLIAASFVFGPLRSVAAGTRVFYGIIVGLCFKYAQDLLAPSSVLFHFSPLWAVLVPIVMCWMIGLALLKRQR